MLSQTKGIVFKTIKYGETSVITTIYTQQYGLRKYMVNGVRKHKSKTPAVLFQPGAILDMVVYHREDKELNRTGEIRPAYIFEQLPFDIIRSSISLFIVELAQKTIREPEANPELFQLLCDTLVILDQHEHGIGNLHLVFMAELSKHLGFMPAGEFRPSTPYFDLREACFCGTLPSPPYGIDSDIAEQFSLLYDCQIFAPEQIQLGREQRRLLLETLIKFYQYHMENMPELHAHEVLQQVLS